MNLTHVMSTPSPSLASVIMRISAASRNSGSTMPLGGTRGRAMAMKDTRTGSATGSSPALEASREEMVVAKYVGSVRGRRSEVRLKPRAAAVARRWRCYGAAELA